jgi:hypothetical protein
LQLMETNVDLGDALSPVDSKSETVFVVICHFLKKNYIVIMYLYLGPIFKVVPGPAQ